MAQFADTGRGGGQTDMRAYGVIDLTRAILLDFVIRQRCFDQIDAIIMVHVILVIHVAAQLDTVEFACCKAEVESIVHVA